ncbi:hypothetical protein H9P43_006963 [Blastocladiella emersonii ATCC 22665]|nr:hypothetical protein H9P43_006963 [Blastocladiella emersonii ATCC 22665]
MASSPLSSVPATSSPTDPAPLLPSTTAALPATMPSLPAAAHAMDPPQPAYFYGADEGFTDGAPVFTPTAAEFADFDAYVAAVDKAWGHRYGVVKVIPPPEWAAAVPDIRPRLAQANIVKPISQQFEGGRGVYRQLNAEVARKYSAADFARASFTDGARPPYLRHEPHWADDHGSSAGAAPPSPAVSLGVASTTGDAAITPRITRASARQAKALGLAHPPEMPTSSLAGDTASEASLATPSATPVRPAPPVSPAQLANKPAQCFFTTPAAAEAAASASSTHNDDETPPEPKRARRHFRFEAIDLDAELADGPFEDDLFTCRFPARYVRHELEEEYWRSIGVSCGSAASHRPVYGADLQGTLWPSASDPPTWNTNRLDTILARCLRARVAGVNTPYLYFGTWRATFGWHCEDADLYSINYLHLGAPKAWYALGACDAAAFDKLAAATFPRDAHECAEFVRHKTLHMSPAALAAHGLTVHRLVQNKGEFVLTFPRGYHSGFNLGFNCAESVNFALPRWFDIGKRAGTCQCENFSVGIDVAALEKAYHALLAGGGGDPDSPVESEASAESVTTAARGMASRQGRVLRASAAAASGKQPRGVTVALTDFATPTVLDAAVHHHSDAEGGDEAGDAGEAMDVVPAEPAAPRRAGKRSAPGASATAAVKPESGTTTTGGGAEPRRASALGPLLTSFLANPRPCLLCPRPDDPDRYGALLPCHGLPAGVNAHRTCATGVPETWAHDDHVYGVAWVPRERLVMLCAACHVQGVHSGPVVQCGGETCNRSFHVACALDEGQARIEEGVVKVWCRKHAPKIPQPRKRRRAATDPTRLPTAAAASASAAAAAAAAASAATAAASSAAPSASSVTAAAVQALATLQFRAPTTAFGHYAYDPHAHAHAHHHYPSLPPMALPDHLSAPPMHHPHPHHPWAATASPLLAGYPTTSSSPAVSSSSAAASPMPLAMGGMAGYATNPWAAAARGYHLPPGGAFASAPQPHQHQQQQQAGGPVVQQYYPSPAAAAYAVPPMQQAPYTAGPFLPAAATTTAATTAEYNPAVTAPATVVGGDAGYMSSPPHQYAVPPVPQQPFAPPPPQTQQQPQQAFVNPAPQPAYAGGYYGYPAPTDYSAAAAAAAAVASATPPFAHHHQQTVPTLPQEQPQQQQAFPLAPVLPAPTPAAGAAPPAVAAVLADTASVPAGGSGTGGFPSPQPPPSGSS